VQPVSAKEKWVVAPPPSTKHWFTPAENNAIAEKFFDSAWNRGDFKSVAYILAPDVVDHSLVPGQKEGPEKFKMIVGMFRAALPDVHMTIEGEVYAKDKVVHRWLVQGHHTGAPLFGVPATHKKITLSGITMVRLAHGQFKERWTQLDQVGLLTQLGVIPPQKSTGPKMKPKVPVSAKGGAPIPPEANNAIAEKFFETAWNKGDFASVEALLSPKVVDHSTVPGQAEGPEKFKMIVGMFRAALPDVHMSIEDEVYAKDMIVHRWKVQGHHTGGALFGVKPTNKLITLTGISMVRLKNGQFVERWTQLDMLGLMQQLGLAPAPPKKTSAVPEKKTPLAQADWAKFSPAAFNAAGDRLKPRVEIRALAQVVPPGAEREAAAPAAETAAPAEADEPATAATEPIQAKTDEPAAAVGAIKDEAAASEVAASDEGAEDSPPGKVRLVSAKSDLQNLTNPISAKPSAESLVDGSAKFWQTVEDGCEGCNPWPSPNIRLVAGEPEKSPALDQPVVKKPVMTHALNLTCLRGFKAPVNRFKGPEDKFWERDFMTGNWGGARDRLSEKGLDVTLALIADGRSLKKGSESRSAYDDLIVVSFDAFPERWGGPTHSQIHWTNAVIQNANVKNNFSNSLNFLSTSDNVNTSKVFELWYGRKFDSGKGEWRLGKSFPFVRIASTRGACILGNGSFNYPTFLGFGVSLSYFAAPIGVQLSYQPKPKWFFIGQVSDGYDDASASVNNKHGFNFHISNREGVEGIFEAQYRNHMQPGDKGLPGAFKVGVQFHTGEFRDKAINTAGLPIGTFGGEGRESRGNYGLYSVIDQQVTREGTGIEERKQGLNLFAKAFTVPNDVNVISFSGCVGAYYQGLIPKRDYDLLSVGFSHTRFSSSIKQLARDSGGEVPSAENVLEATYVFQIAPWWALELDYQRIMKPSGLSSNPNERVLGVSTRWGF
jgi:porin